MRRSWGTGILTTPMPAALAGRSATPKGNGCEWLFRRVLDGMAIGDLFICPSRATREEHPQPDGEYGMAIRMYDPDQRRYDMVYTCNQSIQRLQIHQADGCIVCTVLDRPAEHWRFSDITPTSFRWQNVTDQPDGTVIINCEVLAHRRA